MTSPPPLPPEREQGGAGLPPETLAAIQRRVDAATEAPWTVEHDQRNEETRIYALGGALRAFLDGRVLMNEHADGEFLAHARQDIPALLAHATALARQLQEADGASLALARRVEAAERCARKLGAALTLVHRDPFARSPHCIACGAGYAMPHENECPYAA